MKTVIISLSLFVAVATAMVLEDCEKKCKSCKPLEKNQCLAGVEKDSCGCCDVCMRFEGQKCDVTGEPHKHGNCGYGLTCKNAVGAGNICQCNWEEMLCGTDGVTYLNLCHLMAARLRKEESDEELNVKDEGPCSKGAHIVTKPAYVRNISNSDVVLNCEAVGYPTPGIYWEVTRANNETYELPGHDYHLVTVMRGGPGKYQVTGWVQIDHLQKEHEGDYTCIAYNKYNKDKARARVKVVD